MQNSGGWPRQSGVSLFAEKASLEKQEPNSLGSDIAIGASHWFFPTLKRMAARQSPSRRFRMVAACYRVIAFYRVPDTGPNDEIVSNDNIVSVSAAAGGKLDN